MWSLLLVLLLRPCVALGSQLPSCSPPKPPPTPPPAAVACRTPPALLLGRMVVGWLPGGAWPGLLEQTANCRWFREVPGLGLLAGLRLLAGLGLLAPCTGTAGPTWNKRVLRSALQCEDEGLDKGKIAGACFQPASLAACTVAVTALLGTTSTPSACPITPMLPSPLGTHLHC